MKEKGSYKTTYDNEGPQWIIPLTMRFIPIPRLTRWASAFSTIKNPSNAKSTRRSLKHAQQGRSLSTLTFERGKLTGFSKPQKSVRWRGNSTETTTDLRNTSPWQKRKYFGLFANSTRKRCEPS